MYVKTSILKFLGNDWHFLLLIIFFITHGYAEYVGLVPIKDLLLLLVVLIIIAFILYWLSRPIFRDHRKAAIFTSFFLAIFLFFGAFQDFLGRFQLTSALAQLRVFVPVSLIIILIGLIILKRSTRRFERLNIFLNVLLAIYILIDVAIIVSKLLLPSSKNTKDLAAHGLKLSICDTCARPSIYFILLDEYSGSDALKAYFNYDNSSFEQFLQSQGFKVNQHTTSNYVFTVFSVASTLNMNYIHGLGVQSAENHYGYRKATTAISKNITTRFLKQLGYRINNYSYFQLPESPAVFKADYLPGKIALITHKTLYSRVIKELVRVLANKYSISYFQQRSDAFYIDNNEAMMKRALVEAAANQPPTFNYLHLMLPHDPIAFDSSGKRITPFWQRSSYTKKDMDEAYLQYLVYTNNRMRSFISELKQKTGGQAIIMLLSDHGYRGSTLNNETKWRYHTLNAIYLPGQNYKAWYNGMSNVNQWRALLNTSFGQKLPMLKDSLVY